MQTGRRSSNGSESGSSSSNVLAVGLGVALLTVGLVGTVLATPAQAAEGPNEEQTGRSAWCTVSLESTILKNPPVSELRRENTLGTVDPVEPGTEFDLWIEDLSDVHEVVITFYRSDGTKIMTVHNETVGGDRPSVPTGAAWGKVCIRLDLPLPVILTVNPALEWHYQDGFSS